MKGYHYSFVLKRGLRTSWNVRNTSLMTVFVMFCFLMMKCYLCHDIQDISLCSTIIPASQQGAVAGLLVLLDKGQVLVDVIGGADHEGHTLVKRFRLNVHYPLSASGGKASRLLDEESDGVAFIQQPQLWGEDLKKNTMFFSCCFLFFT